MMENNNIPDANQSWEAAEKLIDKHFRMKKLRRILLFFSVPALLILLGLFFIPGKKNANVKQNLSHEVQQTPGVAKNNLPVQVVESENTVVSNSQTGKSSTSIKNSADKQTINNLSNIDKQTISTKPFSEEKNISTNLASKNKDHEIKKKNSIEEKLTKAETSVSIQKVNTKVSENKAVIHSSKESISSTVKTQNVIPEKSIRQTDEHVERVISEDQQTDKTAMLSAEPSLPVNNLTETELLLNSEIAYLNSFATNLPVKSKSAETEEKTWPKVVKNSTSGQIAWETSITGGVHYMNKSLVLNSEWNNYFTHRKNEEEAIVVPSIGIAVSATYKSFSLSMGVEYAVYGERTNYYPYSIQPTITETSGWNVFLTDYVDVDTAYITGNQLFLQTIRQIEDSNFVVTRDTVEEYKYDEAIAKSNGVNHSYYLELPIELSYCLNRGRAGFGISGGVAPAMLTTQNGHYLRTDGKGIESLSEIKTFRKYLFNARLSADFYYRFSDKAKFVLRPQIRSNLNSVFEIDYGIKQKYFSTGVLFGVSFMLN